jgi:hypothetical protein
MKNKILEDVVAMLHQASIGPRLIRNRHWKLTWTDQHGRTRMLVVAFSPNSRRARTQSRATLRKLLAS